MTPASARAQTLANVYFRLTSDELADGEQRMESLKKTREMVKRKAIVK